MQETFVNYVPFAFPVLWCVICAFLSKLSGWSRLAKSYPVVAYSPGNTYWFCSMKFGEGLFGVTYGNCVFLNVGNDGIKMSVFFLFRVGHPPLFLPWEKVLEMYPHKFLFGDYYALKCEGLTINFVGKSGGGVYSKFREIRKLGPYDPAREKKGKWFLT